MEQQKQRTWAEAAIVLFVLVYRLIVLVLILVGIALLCSDCKPKPKPVQPPAVSTPQVDSVRLKLEQSLQTSRDTAQKAGQQSQSAVTDYEKAKEKFDQSRVTLP